MCQTFRAMGAVILAALSIPALYLSAVTNAEALELVISGNGEGSASEVSVASNTNTQVTQTNNAQVNNNVAVDSNTGENSISANSGGNSIVSSGDVGSKIDIQNDVNSSVVSKPCCPQNSATSLDISDNGTDTKNSIILNQNQTTQVNITQEVNIKNQVISKANTGSNEANNNTGGNTSITTGNINVNLSIKNTNINNASSDIGGGGGGISAKIDGNGTDSRNSIYFSGESTQLINIKNSADIANIAYFELNTGGNKANGNSGGNVSIATGDIRLDLVYVNGPINSSSVGVGCCLISDPADPNDPQDPDDPGDPGYGGIVDTTLPPANSFNPGNDAKSSSSSSDSGGGSSSGGVLGAILGSGQILPATGSWWTIFLTIIAAILFMIGIYLRLHPGRDPSKA
jgi:hypothetical protein